MSAFLQLVTDNTHCWLILRVVVPIGSSLLSCVPLHYCLYVITKCGSIIQDLGLELSVQAVKAASCHFCPKGKEMVCGVWWSINWVWCLYSGTASPTATLHVAFCQIIITDCLSATKLSTWLVRTSLQWPQTPSLSVWNCGRPAPRPPWLHLYACTPCKWKYLVGFARVTMNFYRSLVTRCTWLLGAPHHAESDKFSRISIG